MGGTATDSRGNLCGVYVLNFGFLCVSIFESHVIFLYCSVPSSHEALTLGIHAVLDFADSGSTKPAVPAIVPARAGRKEISSAPRTRGVSHHFFRPLLSKRYVAVLERRRQGVISAGVHGPGQTSGVRPVVVTWPEPDPTRDIRKTPWPDPRATSPS